YVPGGKRDNGFSSKDYGIDVSPKVMFAQSDLLALLVQSKVYKYLEFQSLSNFHVFENDHFKSKLSNTTKEEIFTDQSLSLTTKRSLMKFLKFVLSDDAAAKKRAPCRTLANADRRVFAAKIQLGPAASGRAYLLDRIMQPQKHPYA
ncbi:hypothetical protein OXX59_010458, partial [Metschnikowia pulcherrima]